MKKYILPQQKNLKRSILIKDERKQVKSGNRKKQINRLNKFVVKYNEKLYDAFCDNHKTGNYMDWKSIKIQKIIDFATKKLKHKNNNGYQTYWTLFIRWIKFNKLSYSPN